MAEPKATGKRYRFGRFELDTVSGTLSREGKPVPLHEKPLEILLILLENSGEIVSRRKIVARLWPDGVHVDFDNNLNASIRKLREALGDSAGQALYVETLPRKGYRMVAPIRITEPTNTEADVQPPHNRYLWPLGLLILMLLAYAVFRQRENLPTPNQDAKVMLAFLPFVAIGQEEALQTISAGITEELITQCGGFAPNRLGVIAATSVRGYRDTEKPISQIGEELGVDFIVEGAVQKEQNRLRFTVQLIRVRDQSHVWSKAYTRDDEHLLDARMRIGLDVTRHLIQNLNIEVEPRPESHISAAAYDDLLKARYHLAKGRREGYQQARGFLEAVIVAEPGYAPGHALLAETHLLLAVFAADPANAVYPEAEAAARAAIALDPQNGLAWACLGYARMYGQNDWQGAGEAFERALALAPGSASVHSWAAAWLSVVARHHDALEAAERARLLDPLSLNVNRDLAWYCYFAEQYDRALAQAEHVRELDPNAPNFCGLFTHWARKDGEAALDLVAGLIASSEEAREAFQEQRRQGFEAADAWLIERLRAGGKGFNLYLLANRLTAAGRNEEALAALQEAWSQKAVWLSYAPVDPGFRPLYAEPAFEEMVREMGLPIARDGNRYRPAY